jgi:hypothetical protein
VVRNDLKIKTDFEARGVDTVNFAKKLLGQIVFLYFLQKKGWFGVGRDDEWGTGSKHFLRELFEKKHADYDNFFNDILEPLFYEALRTGQEREHEDFYYSRFDCKIPFLNGGLFDPIGGYDWVKTVINIPDKLFSNKTKNNEGDGILDIFDLYNFTVKEDEPLEKEVAIDPELLGKAYEKFNAIRPDNYAEFKKALKSGKTGEENKFNKKFGVYYTPREIVHYMCQQSLINYLHTELNSGITSYKRLGDNQLDMLGNKGKKGQLDLTIENKPKPDISKKDIEALIHTGEQVSENEATALLKEQLIAEGKQKTTKNKLLLPESIKNNAALIDNKLEEITVCDPAVGSGAFPVGMMSEIVKARNVLSVFLNDKDQSACDSQARRTTYDFKRSCIEHSLYGVDIDPGAVEIAKLRLWLSLVVDEDDIKNIKPLPNLDYRIMQGNSLISEFVGINFDSDKEKKSGKLIFKDETDELIEQFQKKKDEFLNESNVSRKTKLKENVDDLLVEMFETKLRTEKADYFNKIKYIENKHSNWPTEKQRNESIKRDKEKLYKETGFDLEFAESQLKEFTSGNKIKPFFLWNLYFSEVFYKKGGFDIVIANPPYVRVQKLSHKIIDLYKKTWSTAWKRIDISTLFFELGYTMLNTKGILCFISSNQFTTTEYGRMMRRYLLEKSALDSIVDFGDLPVFENALTYVSIFLLSRNTKGEFDYHRVSKIPFELPVKFSRIELSSLSDDIWSLGEKEEIAIIKKLQTNANRLDKYAKCWGGIITGKDDLLLFEKDEKVDHIEKDLIFPVIRAQDCKRYGYAEASKKTFYPYKESADKTELIELDVLRNKYPKSYSFINEHEKELKSRKDSRKPFGKKEGWYGLIRFGHLSRFRQPKIVSPGEVKENKFSLDLTGAAFSFARVYSIACKDDSLDIKYLLAILNSKLIEFYLHKNASLKQGGYYTYSSSIINAVPLKFNHESQKMFIPLVDIILSITRDEYYLQNPQKQAKVKGFEAEIDQLVYKLYDLTPEEIKIVEGKK